MSASPLIGTLPPFTSMVPVSHPARSISFSLKNGTPTMASNCGTGSKYSDSLITVRPTLSSNGHVLCMSCTPALLTASSTGRDLIRRPGIPFRSANLDEGTEVRHPVSVSILGGRPSIWPTTSSNLLASGPSILSCSPNPIYPSLIPISSALMQVSTVSMQPSAIEPSVSFSGVTPSSDADPTDSVDSGCGLEPDSEPDSG